MVGKSESFKLFLSNIFDSNGSFDLQNVSKICQCNLSVNLDKCSSIDFSFLSIADADGLLEGQ